METKSTTAALPTLARAWIAIGFAAVAIAAVMSNAQAFAGGSSPVASGTVVELPSQLAELSAQVDWAKVPLSNITPAESIAAYDR